MRGVEGDLGGSGATDLQENAQDSQALRPRSGLTQAVIGIRVVMYDVELRGEAWNHCMFPHCPLPKASTLAPTPTSSSMSYICPTQLGIIPQLRLCPVSRSFLFPAAPVPVSVLVQASPPGTSAADAWLLIWCSDPPGDPF